MSELFDDEIFEGKKFSDLLKEIHGKSDKKAKQIKSLIDELRPLVKNVGDATIIVPMIKDYLDVGVKNDELLVKISVVIQRQLQKSTSGGSDFEIPTDEIDQLISNYNENQKSIDKIKSTEEKVKGLSEQEPELNIKTESNKE